MANLEGRLRRIERELRKRREHSGVIWPPEKFYSFVHEDGLEHSKVGESMLLKLYDFDASKFPKPDIYERSENPKRQRRERIC